MALRTLASVPATALTTEGRVRACVINRTFCCNSVPSPPCATRRSGSWQRFSAPFVPERAMVEQTSATASPRFICLDRIPCRCFGLLLLRRGHTATRQFVTPRADHEFEELLL